MRRVLIVGSGGAGKSTLARALGPILGLPVIHLDAQYWLPGWQEPPKADWQKRVAELVERDCWIMDGNYGRTLEERVIASDTIIVLALPRLQCVYRIVKRGIRYRGRTRPDLNEGCPEHWPSWSFLSWIWTFPGAKLPAILRLLSRHESQKRIVVLRSSADVRRFLKSVTESRPQPSDDS